MTISNNVYKKPIDYEPSSSEIIYFGMGCFWGAEKIFWQLEGVYHTSVGYAGGYTKNPTYDEVCSGLTGHTEVVRVVYDPKKLNLKKILLEVSQGNVTADKFYSRFDFSTVGIRKNYYKNGSHALLKEKKLTTK